MAMVNTSIKINEETKKETQKLFKDLGLSLSTAKAIREKGIPFYINSLPENSELAQAFEEARQIKKNLIIVQKKYLKMSWEKTMKDKKD